MTTLRPLWSLVESKSWHLETAGSGWEALERVQSGVAPHLLILDLPRDDRDGLHALRWFRQVRPELPIVLICHPSDAGKRTDAIRLGADEVLVRPFPDEELELLIRRFLACPKSMPTGELISENIESLGQERFFVSASPLMLKLRAQAEMLAQADFPVLLLGEKGSGKATTARLIHRLSVRSSFRFSRVNCTAMPADLLEKELFGTASPVAGGHSYISPGKLEMLEKGTLLLDEITALPNQLQARLLALLQDGCYVRSGSEEKLSTDVRIVASTSANIERALAEKRLREDLYYHLSAFTIHVPPLRQRREEIRVLLRHFMRDLARHYGLPARDFSPTLIEACQGYSWPGNLTELETFVKRYLVTGEQGTEFRRLECVHPDGVAVKVDSADLDGIELSPDEAECPETGPRSLKAVVQCVKHEAERNAIGQALEKTGWNRKAAARLLKVSYRTLLYKIEQYQLHSSESFLSPLSPVPGIGPGSKAK